jgi:pyruvate dehydrogenase E1 component
MLEALARLGRSDGTSSYFRLTTRPADQELAAVPADPAERAERRRAAVAGGYRLVTAATRPVVTLVGMGAVMPEVVAAGRQLESDGLACDVVCLTSADLIFRAVQARQGLLPGGHEILDTVFRADRAAPIVSVLDGHPHTLAFLAAVNATPIACLGVHDFGQVGDVADLYRHFSIDATTVVGAAWDLVERIGS